MRVVAIEQIDPPIVFDKPAQDAIGAAFWMGFLFGIGATVVTRALGAWLETLIRRTVR